MKQYVIACLLLPSDLFSCTVYTSGKTGEGMHETKTVQTYAVVNIGCINKYGWHRPYFDLFIIEFALRICFGRKKKKKKKKEEKTRD